MNCRLFLFPSRLYKLILVTLMGVCLSACGGSGSGKISGTYDGFVSNVSAGRGHNAAKFVTDDSISRYAELKDLALFGGPGMDSLTIHDEVVVYLLREHYEKTALEKLSDRDVFNFAVIKGMIGPTNFSDYKLGAMRTTDTEARVELMKDGEKTPYSIFFRIEDGKWKIRTRQLQANMNDVLQDRIFQFGGRREDIINELLKTNGTGNGMTAKLRKPLARKD